MLWIFFFSALMQYTSISLCARYYRFDDDVFIFPNVSNKMIVKSYAEAINACKSYANASLISVKSRGLQTFLVNKMNAIYLQYSEIQDAGAFIGAVTGGIQNGSHLWKWQDGSVFYDQITHQAINGAYTAWLKELNEPDNLGYTNCYHTIMFSKNTTLTPAWNWADVKCNETQYEYYAPCSKPLRSFLNTTTDKRVYDVDKGSRLAIDVQVVSDRYPVQLNLSLNSEKITVHDMKPVSFYIPYVFENMTGNHYVMSFYDEVFFLTNFTLKVKYLSGIEITQIVNNDGFVSYLKCSALGYPNPEIRWSETQFCRSEESNATTISKNDVINFSGPKDSEESERIWVGNSSAAAVFTCTAENPYARLNRTITLQNPFHDLLKLSLVLNVKNENSVAIQWHHSLLSFNYSLLSTVKYEIKIATTNGDCRSMQDYFLFSYPLNSLLISGLCGETQYNIKLTSRLNKCDVNINKTHQVHFFVGKADNGNESGSVIALCIIIVLLLLLLGYACYTHHQNTVRRRKYVPNIPISYRQLLLSQSEYRSQELPADPGYSSAMNTLSISARRISNIRTRAAAFFGNHSYCDMGENTAASISAQNSRTRAFSEHPYEVVTITSPIYSFAGDEGPIPDSSTDPTEYSFANEASLEPPKYATLKRKSAISIAKNQI